MSKTKLLQSTLLIILLQSLRLVSVAGIGDGEITPNVALWEYQVSPASHPRVPSLHVRRQGNFITSTNGTLDSTLTGAEKIVRAAREETRIRNTYLVEHPRRNIYEFRNYHPDVTVDNSTGTGVNTTVENA
jgi:hypothetical protein